MAQHPVQADLGAALAKALEARRVVVRRPPGSGALCEHLEGLGADSLCAVDSRVDAAGRRQMRADVHLPTLAEPRLQARRLRVDVAACGAGERCEWRQRDLAFLVRGPGTGDDAVDEEGLRDVAVLRDHRLA